MNYYGLLILGFIFSSNTLQGQVKTYDFNVVQTVEQTELYCCLPLNLYIPALYTPSETGRKKMDRDQYTFIKNSRWENGCLIFPVYEFKEDSIKNLIVEITLLEKNQIAINQ